MWTYCASIDVGRGWLKTVGGTTRLIDRIRNFWRSMFDVREGELGRTLFMALYLMFALFAYYILKAVSRGMFLAEFDIDKLPFLYIFIALGGGVMAYVYTKIAVNSSLATAVNLCTFGLVGILVLIWSIRRASTGPGCCMFSTYL